MDDRSHLHDAEVLLCSVKSSPAMLAWIIVRSLLDGLIVGVALSVIAFLIAFFAFQASVSLWIYAVITILSYVGVLVKRVGIWNHCRFRITSERVLLEDPHAFFHAPMHTVKWPQYQESHTGHRTFFDFFFGSRPLCIKYGTADALNEVCFPSIRYSQDLKHYLDKVDSAVRRNDLSTVRPFVAKPKGRRDLE